MSKLNPLYVLLLILTFLFISFIKIDDKQKEHMQLKSESKSIKLKANTYDDLKKSWFNKNMIIKKLDRILKTSFKNEKIIKKDYENKITVFLESTNPKVLNKFLSRILNEKFIINNIEIKKTSIFFEIGVK